MRITSYAATHVGQVRQGNEDSFFEGTNVFAVADGMGGHVAGEVASATALEPISELNDTTFEDPSEATEALRSAIEEANRRVVGQAHDNPDLSGMGTTLTAVLVRDERIHLAHVGDSRAYLLRNGEALDQLTTDHTLVEQLVQDGRLSRDEIANHPQRSVITRAIGVEPNVEVDTLAPLVMQPGDQILLCSDGLTGPVSDAEIADMLRDPDGQAVVDRLIQAANEGGGPDNITVVLLRVTDDDAATVPVAAGGEVADAGADDTADEATLPPLGEPPKSIPIRTRPESAGKDWASDMSRYGDRQGVESGTGLDQRPRGRRVLAIMTGVVIIAAILIAGGYLVLSRAYFIGATNGTVGIFNGLPQEVAGVELYREVSDTGLPLASLPPHLQDRIQEGIPMGSLTEAEETVAGYRAELEEADGQSPGGSPTPEPTS